MHNYIFLSSCANKDQALRLISHTVSADSHKPFLALFQDKTGMEFHTRVPEERHSSIKIPQEWLCRH